MKLLTTVANALEASLVSGRLLEAGILSMQRSEALPEYGGGACGVLVEDDDYQRAREILIEDQQGFDDEELARLSEQAAQRARARSASAAPSAAPASTSEPRRWLRRLLPGRRSRESQNPFGR